MGAIVCWSGSTRRGQWATVHHLLHALISGSAAGSAPTAGFAALVRGGIVTEARQGWGNWFVGTSRSWCKLPVSACVVAHCGAEAHESADVEDVPGIPPAVNGGRSYAVVVNGTCDNYKRVAYEHALIPECQCESEAVLRLVETGDHPSVGLDVALGQLHGGMAAAVLDAGRETVWIGRNDHQSMWLLEVWGIGGWFACSSEQVARRAVDHVARWREGVGICTLIPAAANRVLGLAATGELMTA